MTLDSMPQLGALSQYQGLILYLRVVMSSPSLSAADIAPIRHTPTSRQLFMGFLILGMIGFGGVLPLARRMLVEKQRWLTGDEFTEMLGLCQFLPGGNIINMSVAIGMEFRGVKGALASILGLIAVPTAVVVLLGVIYAHYQNQPIVAHAFAGLAAAASGLLLSTAVKMITPLYKKALSILLVILMVVAIAYLRLPMFEAMLVIAPLSILLTWKYPQ